MGKILIIGVLMWLSMANATAQSDSLRLMKTWQLQGYLASALRLDDTYQAKMFLEELHRREPNKDEILLQLGRISYKTRDYNQAEEIFEQLYEKDRRRNLQALYYLSLVQLHREEYEKALINFEMLRLRHRKINEPGVNRAVIARLIKSCEMGIAQRDTVTTIEVTHLGNRLNTPYSECGFILTDEEEFIYAATKPNSRNFHQLDAPYNSVKRFYKASKIDDVWVGEQEVAPPYFNFDDFDTGQGAYSLDRKRFYLTLCSMTPEGKNICQIYVSHLMGDGTWSEPEKLGKEVNNPSFTSAYPTVGSCFDNSLEVIYFVSNQPGGAGGMDIWFSVYNKRQKSYTQAANAGVFINTAGDELSPFFDLPSHRLYFSSNGRAGFGGLDIYYAEGEMVTWQEAVNVGTPINSSYDELNFVRNYSGKFGLFVSNRPGGKSLYHEGCCDDIYAFTDTQTSRVLILGTLVKNDELQTTAEDLLADSTKVVEQLEVIDNKRLTVEMQRPFQTPLIIQGVTTNERGEFQLWVEPGYDYTINVDDTTLLDKSYTFSTRNIKSDETIALQTIPLVSIPQKAIVIENIYYQFDRDELTSDARAALDSTLLEIMKLYPNILVEIGAHTDAVGDKLYNQQLSEKRAENVMRYLISKGVASNRLTSKGFGDSIPVAPNFNPDGSDNAEGRQKNRRTEFRIIGLTD